MTAWPPVASQADLDRRPLGGVDHRVAESGWRAPGGARRDRRARDRGRCTSSVIRALGGDGPRVGGGLGARARRGRRAPARTSGQLIEAGEHAAGPRPAMPIRVASASIRAIARVSATGSCAGPSRNSSAYPRIDASGVRSSCEASARNCWRRSSLCSRSANASSIRTSILFSDRPEPPDLGPRRGRAHPAGQVAVGDLARDPLHLARAAAARSGSRPSRARTSSDDQRRRRRAPRRSIRSCSVSSTSSQRERRRPPCRRRSRAAAPRRGSGARCPRSELTVNSCGFRPARDRRNCFGKRRRRGAWPRRRRRSPGRAGCRPPGVDQLAVGAGRQEPGEALAERRRGLAARPRPISVPAGRRSRRASTPS